jgi:selenide, water dikinase
MNAPASPVRELLLVGGGHAHVQVLRRHLMEPYPGARLTVVLDAPIAVYSGMVPGHVAGQYRSDEVEIDVRALARRAGARVVVSRAVSIDAATHRVHLEGRPPLQFDLCSVNVGSTVFGQDLPGVVAHAVRSRPIGHLLAEVDRRLDGLERGAAVVVVGAGAAGVELAACLAHRLRDRKPDICLLDAGTSPLQGASAALVARVQHALRLRGVRWIGEASVAEVQADTVLLQDGRRLPAALTVWAAGAAPVPLLAASDLPIDGRGWVRVRSDLRVVGRDDVYAVGDCAVLDGHVLPKAGVYAVREGAILADNLRATLLGRPQRAYQPQRDFLALLNLGDGTAIGGKWGQAFEGAWVFRLKDRIDRQFMARFQVLDASGAPSASIPAMPGGGEMICGGCAAKVGQRGLQAALGRLPPAPAAPDVLLGLDAPDDAAAIRLADGGVQLQTVDLFRGFTDDPWLVGRVAAINALSDLLAKGVQPQHALAITAIPDGPAAAQEEALFQVMAGARQELDAHRCALIGGHTTTAPELLVGFSVTGWAPSMDTIPILTGLKAGQALVLTKPLGSGLLWAADAQGRAKGRWIEEALVWMLRSNASASAAMLAVGATAATDITGFGLAGHLGEMLWRSGCSSTINLSALPALPGAAALLAQGLRSTFHPENQRAGRALSIAPAAAADPLLDLIYDPQTSGGLIFGCAPDQVDRALFLLRQSGGDGWVVGMTAPPRPDGALIRVEAGPGA